MVHASHTPEATIAAAIGHVLLYFHDAAPLLKVRHALARVNLRSLPRGVQPLASRALTISCEIHEDDPASAHLIQHAGTPNYVRVQLGLVSCDLVDRDAFICVAQTLHTAAMLAREHFPETHDITPQARVVSIGVRDEGMMRVLRAE